MLMDYVLKVPGVFVPFSSDTIKYDYSTKYDEKGG